MKKSIKLIKIFYRFVGAKAQPMPSPNRACLGLIPTQA